MTTKMRNIIIIVSIVAVIVTILAITLPLVLLRVTPAEAVPDQYKTDWSEDQSFDVNDTNMASTIVIAEDNNANILQLTDIHYDHNNNKKASTLDLINAVITDAKAKAAKNGETLDLITITGDWTSEKIDTVAFVADVFDTIDAHGVAWAPVFGNHDMEGQLARFDYIPIFAEYEFCLFKHGYTNIGGVGNYIINVREGSTTGKLVQSIFMMDSNTATLPHMTKYQPITKVQVAWYAWAVKGLDDDYQANGGDESVIPSLLFHHIPLFEQKVLVDSEYCEFELGANNEGVYPAHKNTHLFDEIIKSGSTKASFVGHDHNNSSVMAYKPPTGHYENNPNFEFRFVYGAESGWCKTYAEENLKGGTSIIFSQDGTLDIDWILFDLLGAEYDKE